VAVDELDYHGSRGSSPREETRRRQQDLVGSLELTEFGPQRLDLRGVGGADPRLLAGVDRGLLAPAAQGVRVDPDPRADPQHGMR